ncbi:MAG TPA: YlxR family protein [Ghiorsea sp.]|nr:YlxR family protein [Ghiorsea sp.]HIP07462.1 YlxR family protein [Mariprofundaceae bacterium]
MQKKQTQRTCFACRKMEDKASLLRLVVDEEGVLWPDLSAKLPSRGVYLCLQEKCLKAMSDKRLQSLKRDFSPQLPQWDMLQQRLFDMLSQRLQQLLNGMRRSSAIGRDAVMHQMWDKKKLLILFAADAGDALLRQVHDAVEKRGQGEMKSAMHATVMVLLMDAKALGLVLGREKVSVVAFSEGNPLAKLQQICVWQQRLAPMLANNKENKVTHG